MRFQSMPRLVLAFVICDTSATNLAAQAPSAADSVARLNQSGHWEAAADLAENSYDLAKSPDELCSLRYGATFAYSRLGAFEIAESDLSRFDSDCAASPAARQHARDLANMRRDLTLPPLPKTGMDFSSVDQFWRLAGLLQKDVEPKPGEWRALFTSVGYRLAMMNVPTTRSDLEIALRPSRRAEFDSLTKRDDDQAGRLSHIAAAVSHRAQIARYRDSVTRALPVLDATALAAKFLPPHATEHSAPPLVAFAIFRDDAYSLGERGVVIDLYHVTSGGGLTLLLAHEFHHTFLSELKGMERPKRDDPAAVLVNALTNMRNEGIADLIDKPHPLSYSSNPLMEGYAVRYNQAYARTPETIRSIDSALVVAADDSTQLGVVGRRVRQLLPSAGHFNGSYVAREIYETFGVDSLYPGAYSPFAFLRTYAAAEAKRGNPAPFSARAWELLNRLEREYSKQRY